MRYGQDCGNPWCKVGVFIVCVLVVLLVTYCLRWLQKLDKETLNIVEQTRIVGVRQLCLCTISGEFVFGGCRIWLKRLPDEKMLLLFMILLAVIAGCLTTASIMDWESCMIYDYVWWLGLAAGVIMLYIGNNRRIMELILFIVLQELFFCKMYGRADCHAFAMCAIAEAAMGMGMNGYLMHMLLAFGLLAFVQGMCSNINKKGNLKHPVPFLPYIASSFWVLIYVNCVLQENILLHIYTNYVDFFRKK